MACGCRPGVCPCGAGCHCTTECPCGVCRGGNHYNRVLTAEQVKKKMEEVAGCLIVNVLEPDYFNDCHITGSINMPLEEIKAKAGTWNKHKDVIVYCADTTSSVSTQAYEILKKMGFEKLYEFKGGMKEWKKKGLPTQGACTFDYLK